MVTFLYVRRGISQVRSYTRLDLAHNQGGAQIFIQSPINFFHKHQALADMPQSTAPKAQPWKTEWPVKSTAASDTNNGGTVHGFEKGKEIVMDGNTNGNTLPRLGLAKQELEEVEEDK
ncbi:hypothetical protein ONS95_006269 [Cadophora gregata]|uniref:uncharacterized protein n=1 Tax=Cadophora gregata TaxID=51156 RepID=UPI0026DDAB82|nr:uncharacterized protein ONS95_006269 [Cadophora gregata]KAK0102665.1 hypothetical protein ONS95_006269 [Cadophora gregata]KAK0104322.1 hypothetical protein ONS96_005408 [Cadophora gregata f. sp. sojae]